MPQAWRKDLHSRCCARNTLIAAVDGRKKANLIADLEAALLGVLAHAHNGPRGLVADRVDFLPEHQALVVGLEEHHVGVAERCARHFDEQLMGSWLGHRDCVEMELVIGAIESGLWLGHFEDAAIWIQQRTHCCAFCVFGICPLEIAIAGEVQGCDIT